jgi:hypothetical protein
VTDIKNDKNQHQVAAKAALRKKVLRVLLASQTLVRLSVVMVPQAEAQAELFSVDDGV